MLAKSVNYQAAYSDALKGLKKTLTGANNFNLDNAILFCGSTGFELRIPPGSSCE
jgi:hypothetical protein